MDDIGDLTKQLADVQKQLWDLPEDAHAERIELKERQSELRAEAAQYASRLDDDRPTDDLLTELAALRVKMTAIEGKRIDLVYQAGSGGSASGEMGNLGGVAINKGIDDAMGLPKVKARIGVIKGTLSDRGVVVPDAD